MKQFKAKVLLFGEYSIFFNSMALTVPFDEYTGKFSYPNGKPNQSHELLSNECLRKFSNFILEHNMDEKLQLNLREFQQELDKGLYFKSNIPQGFGLGSSGALVAAIFLRYFDKSTELTEKIRALPKESIRDLKTTLGQLEDHFHGTSSGLDPLSVLMDEPLLVQPNFDVAPVSIPAFDANGKHTIFLLNTKISRNTEQLVNQFKKACQNEEFTDQLNRQLTKGTNAAINGFLRRDTKTLYKSLQQIIRFQLDDMSFVIPEGFADPIEKGLENGDYYLKICGAGGGGFLLGFTDNWEKTQSMLEDYELQVFRHF
ncbi:MAG: hypothetical protein AAF623_08060 [Planctomycetota bacterium]